MVSIKLNYIKFNCKPNFFPRYFLQPRNKKSSLREDQGFNYPSVGSLRLKIHYTADHVLPTHNYDSLKHLLMNSHAVQVRFYFFLNYDLQMF